MLRTVVEGEAPSAVDFYVNSTPGGLYSHIRNELLAYDGYVEKLVLLVGTNDLRYGIQRAVTSCKEMFSTILQYCRKPQVNYDLYECWFHGVTVGRLEFLIKRACFDSPSAPLY